MELWVEADELDVLRQRRTRHPEHLFEHVWQRQQRRPDVDAEPIAPQACQLAARDVAPLAHHDAPAGGGQSRGHGQATDAGADDDDIGAISHGGPRR